MDFVILKVNGTDLSHASHDVAVEAFRTAKEPITVEVLRRNSSGKTSPIKMKNPKSPPMTTVSTQTDELIEDAYYSIFSPTSPMELCQVNGNRSLVNPSSRQGVAFSPSVDLGLTDIEMANGYDFEDTLDDEFRTFDSMECEEVTLVRTSPEEKLGLTLCYGSGDDEITDIYVSEIEPFSIAAQNEHIREGDQILQINGIDVHSRDQAIQLFAENRAEITLLLARQILQMDDGFMEGQPGFEDILEPRTDMDCSSSLLTQAIDEEEGTTDTATTENSHKHEKDSGVGRTDDSTRNDESSEQELLEHDSTSPGSNKYRATLGNNDLHHSNDSFTSNDTQHDFTHISQEQCNKFQQVLETRCSDGSHGLTRKDSQSSIERELAALNKEMEQIQLECEEIVEQHMQKVNMGLQRGEPFRSPRMVPRMGTRFNRPLHALPQQQDVVEPPVWLRNENLPPRMGYIEHIYEQIKSPTSPRAPPTADLPPSPPPKNKKVDREKDPTTTSAYNTGESCRSTPLTLELHQASDDSKGKNSMLSLAVVTEPTTKTIATTATPKPPAHSDSEKLSANQNQKCTTKEWNSDGDARLAQVSKSQSSTSVSRMSQTNETETPESLQALYAQYADVMYTNRENLQHTIMVQQKLFEQQLLKKNALSAAAAAAQHKSHRKSSKGQGHSVNGDSRSPGGSPAHSVKTPSPNPSGGAVTDNVSPSAGEGGVQMEWVVKRRADGSRYVTRRPIKNKFLKERAKKIAEERCGMTTDDDAQSEMKVGRYWRKEDRKRHIEKAREAKKKKENFIKQKMETLKENDECKKEPNIVELSHRKMMKHKGKKVFDDFTTIQEMLAHGNRESHGKTYNPLLSVTTV